MTITFAKLVKTARNLGGEGEQVAAAKAEMKTLRAGAVAVLNAAKAEVERRRSKALINVFSSQKSRTGAVPLYSGAPGSNLKGKVWAQYIAEGGRVAKKLEAIGQLQEDIYLVERALQA